MGLFDIIKTLAPAALSAATQLISQVCFTFTKQSIIYGPLGITGPATAAAPGFIIFDKQVITQMKIQTRLLGVRPFIDGQYYNQMLQAASQFELANPLQTAQSNISVQALATFDPTFKQPTIVGLVFAKFTPPQNAQTTNYTYPCGQIQWNQLVNTYNDSTALNQVGTAPLFSAPEKLIWARMGVLCGSDNPIDFTGGFTDNKYPGPIRVNPLDCLQFIWSASENLVSPMNGTAGVWAWTSILWSLEFEPDPTNNDDPTDVEKFTLNGSESLYKQFFRT